MSSENVYGEELSYTAGAALEPWRLVKQDGSGNAVYNTATDTPIGATTKRALSAGVVGVRMFNAPGFQSLTASKAIAINTVVYGAASGKITDSSAGSAVKLGISMAAAAADGDVIPVQMYLSL